MMPSNDDWGWWKSRKVPPEEMRPLYWRDVFKQCDVNNDGVISPAELKEFMRKEMRTDNIPEETAQRIMEKIHQDANGDIDVKVFERLNLIRLFYYYDEDENGRISRDEFDQMINDGKKHHVPKATVELMEMGDVDGDGSLNLEEFLNLAQMREFREAMGDMLNTYVKLVVVVPGYRVRKGGLVYEEQYSCHPPKLGMAIVTAVQIILFACDNIWKTDTYGPVASFLCYDPGRRYQVWRYLTYMFVHSGGFHLSVNLFVQILLGVPLEMVHDWWRVLVIYLGGVVFGSLGSFICDPDVRLVGASGGVYALIAAHLASIVMNCSEMRYLPLQVVVFFILIFSDLIRAIYNRYDQNEDNRTSYAAHYAGAIAGFFLGVIVLRNLKVKKWEKRLRRVSINIFVALMLAAIVWNFRSCDTRVSRCKDTPRSLVENGRDKI